jgi:hypothetical protein
MAMLGWNANIAAQTFTIADFESDAIGKTYNVYTQYYSTDGKATVAANPSKPAQKSLHVEVENYNVRVKFNVTLPQGKTLADYENLQFDSYWTLTGDARYKQMLIYINETEFVKSGYDMQGDASVWAPHSYSLSGLSTALSGLNSFELQIGISLSSGDYYLDDIRLSGSGGSSGGGEASYYLIDFDATLPTAKGIVNNAGTAVSSGSAVVEAAPGRTGNALHATFGGYEQNLQMSITLPAGKTLSDYENIELDIYYGTSGDNTYKDVKYSLNNGTKTKIDATSGSSSLGVWKTLSIPLSATGGNTFTFEIGYNAPSGANFYIDNFKMKEKAGTVNPPTPGASVFEDFETKSIGDVYDMKRWYPEDGSATVVADPANAAGKSVHVITSNWDAFLRMNIQLPEGKTLNNYETFSFDIYIGNNSNDEYPNYKNLFIYLDDVKKYEENDYPKQADIATWTTKTFTWEQLALTNEEKAKTNFTLAFGMSTDKGDYYIDNVRLTEKDGGETSIPVINLPQNMDWSKATNIQVYNMNGQRLNIAFPTKNSCPAGLYIVKGQIEGKTISQKILITK